MADSKISALTELATTSIAGDDVTIIVDTSAADNKKLTLESVANYANTTECYTDSGAADAYVLTSVGDFDPTYTTGMPCKFLPTNANTGASTVNVESLGVKNIKKYVSGSKVDPVAGDIAAYEICELTYDGTDFVLCYPARDKASHGRESNVVYKYVTAATFDIDADWLPVYNSAGDVILLDSVNVTCDISTGTGANTLDTGSEASSTHYYAYVIYNPSADTIASLVSASATSPTLPSGYTHSVRLNGHVYNDGSSNFVPFLCTNGKYRYTDQITVLSTTGATTSWQSTGAISTIDPQVDHFVANAGLQNAGSNCLLYLAANTTPDYEVNIWTKSDANTQNAIRAVCTVIMTTAQTFAYKITDTLSDTTTVINLGYDFAKACN